jgi:hypothetical protein
MPKGRGFSLDLGEYGVRDGNQPVSICVDQLDCSASFFNRQPVHCYNSIAPSPHDPQHNRAGGHKEDRKSGVMSLNVFFHAIHFINLRDSCQ